VNVLTGVFRLGAVVQSGPRARPVSPKGGIAQTRSPAHAVPMSVLRPRCARTWRQVERRMGR